MKKKEVLGTEHNIVQQLPHCWRKSEVPLHLAPSLLVSCTCSFPGLESMNCFTYTEKLFSLWSRGYRFSLFCRRTQKNAQIWTSNAMGVVIVLSPCDFQTKWQGSNKHMRRSDEGQWMLEERNSWELETWIMFLA